MVGMPWRYRCFFFMALIYGRVATARDVTNAMPQKRYGRSISTTTTRFLDEITRQQQRGSVRGRSNGRQLETNIRDTVYRSRKTKMMKMEKKTQGRYIYLFTANWWEDAIAMNNNSMMMMSDMNQPKPNMPMMMMMMTMTMRPKPTDSPSNIDLTSGPSSNTDINEQPVQEPTIDTSMPVMENEELPTLMPTVTSTNDGTTTDLVPTIGPSSLGTANESPPSASDSPVESTETPTNIP